jgi:DNA-binding transcriptional MerR regulator
VTSKDIRRYTISEVSDATDVPDYVLRQWESRFPQLKPKRNRANRRCYTTDDIELVRRIRQLVWNEKMTTEGARKRLSQELRGEGRPRTRSEAVDLVDNIEAEVRSMLDMLDSV